MKQKITSTFHNVLLPVLLFVSMGVATNTFAQTTNNPPAKNTADILLGRRAALEVIDKALASWGEKMNTFSADPNSPQYKEAELRFSILFATNNLLYDEAKLTLTQAIERASKLVWSTQLTTDDVLYNTVTESIRNMFHKSNFPQYKENY
jgi:hypothetical protein